MESDSCSSVLNNIDDIALHFFRACQSYYNIMKTCIRFLDEDREGRICLRNVTLEFFFFIIYLFYYIKHQVLELVFT